MLDGKLTDLSFSLCCLKTEITVLQTMSSFKPPLDTINLTVIWYVCEQFFFLGLSFDNTFKYI